MSAFVTLVVDSLHFLIAVFEYIAASVLNKLLWTRAYADLSGMDCR